VSLLVLDTDVASTILHDRLTDPLRSCLIGHSLCITFVTLGDMTMSRVLPDWDPRRPGAPTPHQEMQAPPVERPAKRRPRRHLAGGDVVFRLGR
jgi:hypothetical protein